MRGMIWGGGAALVLMSLACAGLGIGPGADVASTSVSPGQPAVLSHTTTTADPLGIWLTYDLDYQGASTYVLTGPFEVRVDGQTVRSTSMSFKDEGGPLADQSSRMTWGTVESSFGTSGSASGQIWMGEVDPGKVGAQVQVELTGTPSSSTTVNALSLRLTQ